MKAALRYAMGAGCALALVLAIGQSADASLIVTLENPNPTIALPTSGLLSLDFFGSVTLDPDFTAYQTVLNFVYQGGTSPYLTGDGDNLPYTAGGTFTGLLFHMNIDSTSALGFYDQASGGGPALFVVDAYDSNNIVETGNVAYTVNLVQAVSAPEPSSIALLAAGLLGAPLIRTRSKSRRLDRCVR